MEVIDILGAAVVLLALLRGFWIGVVRELFSIGALAAGICVARWGALPFGAWLVEHLPQLFGELAATVTAAILLAVGSAMAVGFAGRLLRRGLHAAGLATADRLTGCVLGFAEGTLLVGLALWISIQVFDRDHPSIRSTVLLTIFETVEVFFEETVSDYVISLDEHVPFSVRPKS